MSRALQLSRPQWCKIFSSSAWTWNLGHCKIQVPHTGHLPSLNVMHRHEVYIAFVGKTHTHSHTHIYIIYNIHIYCVRVYDCLYMYVSMCMFGSAYEYYFSNHTCFQRTPPHADTHTHVYTYKFWFVCMFSRALHDLAQTQAGRGWQFQCLVKMGPWLQSRWHFVW